MKIDKTFFFFAMMTKLAYQVYKVCDLDSYSSKIIVKRLRKFVNGAFTFSSMTTPPKYQDYLANCFNLSRCGIHGTLDSSVLKIRKTPAFKWNPKH